jgi:hypothetical protein
MSSSVVAMAERGGARCSARGRAVSLNRRVCLGGGVMRVVAQ